MSDEKMISEREAVKRERAAFVEGMYAQVSSEHEDPTRDERFAAWAARRYPLPRRVVPRVVTDPSDDGTADRQFRVVDSWIECRCHSGPWKRFEDFREGFTIQLTAARIRVWADLLANPTEEVEDDL